MKEKTIVLSRTDSIGDVLLSLPLAGILKEQFPTSKIIFLGRSYTKNIIECSKYVDEIWDWDEIKDWDSAKQISFLKEQGVDVFVHVFPRSEISKMVKKAKIPQRIGTSHRLHHIFTCNNLVNFTRKKSDLHEAQLNTKLLKPLSIDDQFSLEALQKYAGFENIPTGNAAHLALLNSSKKNLIFHAKSQGSALEWGVQNFIQLAENLSEKKYNIFFTGTEKESQFFRHLLPKRENVFDLSGQMSLQELIGFISTADLLLAASTGPLHIAGLTNINCIGLYSPRRPVHPGRWKPLGTKVAILEEQKMSDREGILDITVREVQDKIESIFFFQTEN